MGRKGSLLYPQVKRKLQTAGRQIKLARLRRGLTAEEVAEKAGIGRTTLCSIEKGEPSVSMGNYCAVLDALDLSDDILLLARDDTLGRTIQDLNLKIPRRARKK